MTAPDDAMEEMRLLPCPFCGCEAIINRRMDEDCATHDTIEWITVRCSECSVDFDTPTSGYDSLNAIQLWNRRAAKALASAQEKGESDG